MDIILLLPYRYGEPAGARCAWTDKNTANSVGFRMGSAPNSALVTGHIVRSRPSPDRMDMEALARCSAMPPWLLAMGQPPALRVLGVNEKSWQERAEKAEAEAAAFTARTEKAEKDLVAVRQAGEYWHAEAQRHEERAEIAEARINCMLRDQRLVPALKERAEKAEARVKDLEEACRRVAKHIQDPGPYYHTCEAEYLRLLARAGAGGSIVWSDKEALR